MEKNSYNKLLRVSLLMGAFYFALIAVVHLFGLKIPGFYIYYNVASYQYQDNIISFLVFGWAIFYFTAANNFDIVKPLLIASLFALLGLININFSVDFSAIDKSISTFPFWIQTGLLGIYIAFLFFCYRKTNLK